VKSLRVNSVSAIFTPPAVYLDPFVSFNQRKITYEQGFAFNEIQALTYAYNGSINNYTSHYLTNKKLLTDIFSFGTKQTKKYTITTPFIFNSLNTSLETKYLYVEKDSGLSATNIARRYTVKPLSSTDFDNSIYVELEFIDDKFLRVKHNNGKYDFFLNTTVNRELVFYGYTSSIEEVTTEGSDMFRYIIDSDGYMQLFKNTEGVLNIVALSGTKLALSPILSGRIVKSSENLIKINYTYNEPILKNNTSWISYNVNKINELSIDEQRSDYDRQNQYLLHTSYNNSTENLNINYLTLNNDRSEKGHIKRGSNMFYGSPSVPDAQFREYTTVYTGQNQEKGNDNISLNYVFYDKDIIARSGTDTYFTAPSSIYPFDKLNINDTRFALNGSLGGPSPRVSDKIYLNRKYTSQYNNGRYLCTWLSASKPQDVGVWVDRYYYPDRITKEAALGNNPIYNPSFYDNVDDSDIVNKYNIERGAFFDKKSDLAIEPDVKLRYERLGEVDYEDIVSAAQPYVSGFNTFINTNNQREPYQSSEILFDGSKYAKYSTTDINNTGQFTVSFEAYVDPSKTYGYQLLGNKTTHGFGVRNDVVVTPFVYLKQKNELHIYNSDNVFLSKVYFDADIRDVIPGKPLEDFFVICEHGYIYRVNALGNKLKLEIKPEIAEYINFLQEEDVIIFLLPDDLNNGLKGRCVQVSKTSLETKTDIVATPLKCYNGVERADISKSIYRYNGTLYRIPGDKVRIDGVNSDIIYFVESRKILWRYNFRENSLLRFAETSFSSITKEGPLISDYGIDTNQNIIIAYSNKFVGYTSKRESLFKASLSSVGLPNDIIVNVDFTRGFYLNNNKEDNLRLLSVNPVTREQTIVTVNRNPDNLLLQTTATGLTVTETTVNDISTSIDIIDRFPQTNFNYLLGFLRPNSLKFELTLTNFLSSEDIVNKEIDFDIANLDVGYHTFTYRLDTIQGNASLFVDGVLHKNLTFSPGKYRIQNLFSDDFFVGSTGFLNGVDLATYLQQPGAFYIKDLYVKNLFLYNKALKDDEIIALNLYRKPIGEVVLSIPCGQRNNMEEIERMFKYSRGNSSKTINIYLNNLNIKSQTFRNNIKNTILQEARDILPVGVSINDIKFINYR
jgi:hypothetical protein